MERSGVYRKGRAGHPRNASPYRISKQKFAKWRVPLSVMFSLMLVFGIAPVVGEQFQASLLNVDEITDVATVDPEQARKTVLAELQDFTKDCEKFGLEDCEKDGAALMALLGDPSYEADIMDLLKKTGDFEEKYSQNLALSACVYGLGNAVIEAKTSQRTINSFVERFGEDLKIPGLESHADALNEALKALDGFVESCIKS